MKKKILSVIGARPQFIKHAPVQLEMQKYFETVAVHTGQHYDNNMSKVFFDELKIEVPQYILQLTPGVSQTKQLAEMMTLLDDIATKEKPDLFLIYGDTNSTLAAAMVAIKNNIKLVHIEAGLRSYNRTMPEEVNRIIADEFSWLLFCPTDSAIENLRLEGIHHKGVLRSDDVMCDMLLLVKGKAERLFDFPYYFATIHRPYNTDEHLRLAYIFEQFNALDKKVVFSIHPRTKHKLADFGLSMDIYKNIVFIDPAGYVDNVSAMTFADCILTDSGGIQKEAYMLRKKCITVRSETEWIETLDGGWNTLLFENLESLQQVIHQEPTNYKEGIYGKGDAAKLIVETILKELNAEKDGL
jgi:UDP-GlcNAc3NAcA epimerase